MPEFLSVEIAFGMTIDIAGMFAQHATTIYLCMDITVLVDHTIFEDNRCLCDALGVYGLGGGWLGLGVYKGLPIENDVEGLMVFDVENDKMSNGLRVRSRLTMENGGCACVMGMGDVRTCTSRDYIYNFIV